MIWRLDTGIIVAALRRHAGIRGRLAAIGAEDVGVPAVAVAELAFGAERSRDPARARVVWRESLEPYVVVPFDRSAALEHGRIRQAMRAQPIGARALFIAATANGLTVVTANTREFGRVPGLHVEDWSR